MSRAARSSTVAALAGSARPPRRSGWLTPISALLPVPLLLGLRLAARRPRRVVLTAASIAITVTAIVAVLAYHAHTAASSADGSGLSALTNPRTERVNQVMLVVTLVLIVLAVLNAILITWATALDARRPSALSRALGATPGQISSGLSASQLLPALPGALAGVPAGIGLYAAVSSGQSLLIPPWRWLVTRSGRPRGR